MKALHLKAGVYSAVNKFPPFMEPGGLFIILVAENRPLNPILSQLNPAHTPHAISLRSTLILSSNLYLGPQMIFFLRSSNPSSYSRLTL
jgi:hypothetical protein